VGDFSIGSEVAGYRIEELIARGGMGVVYRATHLGLERPVALKVIARELADRPGFRERFLRESRLAARLEHPSVVPVYDSREVDGELIVAMKLVKGGDLRRLIDREGPLSPQCALDFLAQVAAALDAAHAAGIVHRDVKPHNILVEGNRAYLSDFGLAKAVDESGAASSASVVGTAQYMSPEQWQGGSIGPAADVYSLGCVLYETLTGIPPFQRGEEDTEPELPKGVDAAIRHAVAKDPAQRYPTAGALVDAARAGEGSDVRPTAILSHDPSERTTVPGRSRGFFGLAGGRATAWLVGGAVLFVAAMVAAVLFLLLGDDGLEVSAPITVGTPPLRLDAGPKAVWVTSEKDGTLTRLDPESGEVVLVRKLGVGVSGVAVGSKWTWATNSRRGELLRLDPNTGKLLKTIAVSGEPGPIALGGDRVWVVDEGGEGLTAVNAEAGVVYKRGLPPQSPGLRLAWGADALWVAVSGANTIRRVDPTSLTGESIRVGGGPAGVTVAGGYVWVANSRSGTVTKVDPTLRTVVNSISVDGHPGGIDGGTSAVWVADREDDAVRKIDLESGEVEGAPIQVGPEPGAVSVGGDAVWVANNGDGTVTRIEP